MDCIFCKLQEENISYIIYENKDFFIIPDRDSLGYGHLLIIPKKHVVKVYELGDREYLAIFDLAKRVAFELERITNKKSIAYSAFGSGLPHAHLHLIPHDNANVLIHPSDYTKKLTPEEQNQMTSELKLQIHLSDNAS